VHVDAFSFEAGGELLYSVTQSVTPLMLNKRARASISFEFTPPPSDSIYINPHLRWDSFSYYILLRFHPLVSNSSQKRAAMSLNPKHYFGIECLTGNKIICKCRFIAAIRDL